MTTPSKRKNRIRLLSLVCSLLMIPAALAWLVNLELAVQLAAPGWKGMEVLLPQKLYHALAVLGADLSTVSTLVPLLLLLFPLIMARRVQQFGPDAADRIRRLVYDPYPPHFPFFLVMLGLAGTLYGLLIGLDVSGVEALGGQLASPESIQATVDRLLAGTATALLSSLVGLGGAFLAARPFTWIFHRAVMMPVDDEPLSLSATLGHLIDDMKGLGDASRLFGERLAQTEIQDVPATLLAISEELRGLREELTAANRRIDTLGTEQKVSQDLLAPLAQLSELNRLGAMETLLTDLGQNQSAGNTHQEKLVDLQEQAIRQQVEATQQAAGDREVLHRSLAGIEGVLREMGSRGEDLEDRMKEAVQALKAQGLADRESDRKAREQRDGLMDLLRAAQADREVDRRAVRDAFGQFLTGDTKGQAADTEAP